MPEVTETANLKLNAATAWDRIGHFGAVGDWHPMLERVDGGGDRPGDLRRATGKDGNVQLERLESYDGGAHLYRYTLVETALPVRDYQAEFRIQEAGARESKVVWSAQFKVTGDEREGVEVIRKFLKAGTDALARRYGQAQPQESAPAKGI